jgi:hypothetical protein
MFNNPLHPASIPMAKFRFPDTQNLLPRDTAQGRDRFEAFEKLGVQVKGTINGDFVHAVYPKGWRMLRESYHPAVENPNIFFVDNHNRPRAEVWDPTLCWSSDYKVRIGAPLNRFALELRSTYNKDEPGAESLLVCFRDRLRSTEAQDFRLPLMKNFTFCAGRIEGTSDLPVLRAEEEFRTIFPRHDDPTAYWDEIVSQRVEALHDALAAMTGDSPARLRVDPLKWKM